MAVGGNGVREGAKPRVECSNAHGSGGGKPDSGTLGYFFFRSVKYEVKLMFSIAGEIRPAKAMDIRRWGGSGTQRIVYGRSFSEHNYDRFVTLDTIEIKTTPNKMRRFWRSLRRKLNREKKKVFGCPSTAPSAAQDAYSPHTYSQNFDHGSTWSEPEDLSRSFSARFAAASRVFNSGWTDGREPEKGAR